MARRQKKPKADPRFPQAPEPTSEEVAALSDPGARTDYIADLMRELRYWRGKTGRQLARVWNVSPSKSEVTDKDEVERDINATLAWAMRSAVNSGDRRNAVAAAKAAAEVSGVKAAERHEVMTTEATPENARRLMAEKFGKLTPQGDGEESSGDDAAASE